jgi:hypothetical protein
MPGTDGTMGSQCWCECCGEDVDEVFFVLGRALCRECFVQLQEQLSCPNGRCSG